MLQKVYNHAYYIMSGSVINLCRGVGPGTIDACDEPPVYKQVSGIRQLVGMKVFQEFLAGQA